MRRSFALLLVPAIPAAVLWSAPVQEVPEAARPVPSSDAENVVALHLEGSWEPEALLWERLTGRVIPRSLPPVDARLRIVRDDGAVERLPAEARAALGAGDVQLAGWIHEFGPEPAPFVLTTEHGLPRLTWYQPNGEAVGEESRLVQLVLASKEEADLLFLGPGQPTRAEPFKPYRRAREMTYGDRVGRAKVLLVQLENAAIAYAADHAMAFPTSLQELVVKVEGRGRYLPYETVPRDPWGNEFGYAPPDVSLDRPLPTFTCLGADGKVGGEGEGRDFDNHMIRAGEI